MNCVFMRDVFNQCTSQYSCPNIPKSNQRKLRKNYWESNLFKKHDLFHQTSILSKSTIKGRTEIVIIAV